MAEFTAAVIARESGRSSTPWHIDLSLEPLEYWMPAFAGMTTW